MKSLSPSRASLSVMAMLLAAMVLAAIFATSAGSPVIPALDPQAIIVAPADLPAINAPRITGTTPGRPFLFRVPATGKGPLSHAASGLPEGLAIDEATGIITGSVKEAGEYKTEITVSGPAGSASRGLTIVAGEHKLALTPPMGWNSWNVWGLSVSDEKVRAAADAMVSSGLAAAGFQYINIDDGWEKCQEPGTSQLKRLLQKEPAPVPDDCRDSNGSILTNEKFPDMKGLADYVHSKGLKLGIYSSPGPWTCGRYEGSYGHEGQDARTWAEWGIDYVKYDLCSYREVAPYKTEADNKAPYLLMRDELEQVDRDIVYSLCQYGMVEVWKWGPEVNGNLWRTTGDIRDTWGSMSKIGFGQAGLAPYAGPGHWNDPDMLVVGKVGWGPNLHETRLTPDEQITHVTLWSMLAAPLLIGCDMADLDAFTRAVLTNAEVLEVNQDPLGKQATRVSQKGKAEVWMRPLADGSIAVALFNRSMFKKDVTADWPDLGLNGPQPVRELWRHQDLGPFDGSVTATINPHGAVLLRIGSRAD